MRAVLTPTIMLILTTIATYAQQASITPLPGYNTAPNAVSADGRTVAGSGGATAIKWTATTGLTELPRLPGYITNALGISDDGLVIVGGAWSNSYRSQACRWDYAGITLIGGSDCVASSSDGSTLVGNQRTPGPPFPNTVRAVRWTTDPGLQPLAQPKGFSSSDAMDVSANGAVVVGSAINPGYPSQSVMWTASGEVQLLFPNPNGATYALAKKVSADGQVVVGSIGYPGYVRGFRWTADEGLIYVDSASLMFQASSVSASGAIIVGNDGGSNAMRCSGNSGAISLKSYLQSRGADLSGWSQVTDATDVSADGKIIVGRGTFNGQPTGFIAFAPLECPGDLFVDSVVNGADLGVLLSQWGPVGTGTVGDINRDGRVDGADLGMLLSNWGPCP